MRATIAISAENAGRLPRRALRCERTAEDRGDAPRIAASSEISFDLRDSISYSRTWRGSANKAREKMCLDPGLCRGRRICI
jgi:hypothetical protein